MASLPLSVGKFQSGFLKSWTIYCLKFPLSGYLPIGKGNYLRNSRVKNKILWRKLYETGWKNLVTSLRKVHKQENFRRSTVSQSAAKLFLFRGACRGANSVLFPQSTHLLALWAFESARWTEWNYCRSPQRVVR